MSWLVAVLINRMLKDLMFRIMTIRNISVRGQIENMSWRRRGRWAPVASDESRRIAD